MQAVAATYPHLELREVLTQAVATLKLSDPTDAQALRGFCYLAYRNLYRRMQEIGDFVGALRAVAHLEKMAREIPPPPEPAAATQQAEP